MIGIFRRWFGHGETRSLHPRDPGLAILFGGGIEAASGVAVTPDTAMRAMAVYACVQYLAHSIAAMPLILYRSLPDGGKERDGEHPLGHLLHDQPNGWQTAFEFRAMLQAHLSLRGNAYARIASANGAAVTALVPLHPDRVRPLPRPVNGRLAYEYWPLDGGREILLQAGADVDGGYLVAPQQFVAELSKAVDDQVAIRGLARTFQVPQAASLGAPSLDADPADADWTTELQTGTEDSAMQFGKRELRPHPLAKRIKISQQLLRQALIGPEGLVLDRLAYKFAVTQEKAFLTGSGAGRPLGVFTASPNGISTARDIATGNTTTAIGFDGLIEAKFTLKGQYWPRSRWVFHRDAVRQITKLKDGDGQYIWRQSVREGEPDTLLGLPMTISEWAPNTFTTGLYVGLLGDFQHYWIVDALSMQVQRLNELYAETNQIGFIGRLETDGAPVLEEAFVRVTLA